MHKIKTLFGDKRESVSIGLGVLILLSVCVLHAAAFNHYANFWPINGTFQNFNPVRRLLAGQIPYKEFQDYLGLGHLYSGAITTLLFGGDYQASLIAFSFLSFAGLAMIALVLGSVLFQKKSTVLMITNIILILTEPFLYSNVLAGTSEIQGALNYAVSSGNSARFVRGMILPLSCAFFLAADRTMRKAGIYKRVQDKHRNLIKLSLVGMLAGFSFLWSNDYGVSCWVCLFVMTFLVVLARTANLGRAVSGAAFECMVSILFLFLFVEIFTLGHFGNWFQSVFGTGGYQGWYYNSAKSYYLYDVDFSYIMLIQAFVCLAYLTQLFRSRAGGQSMKRYGIPAYANMTGFCAVNEYKLLSGNNAREVALAVLFVTLLFEACRCLAILLKADRIKKNVTVAASVVCLAWVVSSLKDEIVFWTISDRGGVYVDALGGNMTSLAEDLERTDQFLNGARFFSTYASAQEVVSDLFQPSGTDYIIHVLGDEQREKYLSDFENGDFEYAAVINEDLTPWEFWVERANWFFYRELYRSWHPVYFNEYEIYWERNEGEEAHVLTEACSVSVEDISDTVKKVVVQAGPSVNGTADVRVDYEVRKNERKSAGLLFQRMLKVENTGTVYSGESKYESNFLRDAGAEFVPVRVVNGYGEITLTSEPAAGTCLALNEVSCEEIYPVLFDYVQVSAMESGGSEAVLHLSDNEKNRTILRSARGIRIQARECQISKIQTDQEKLYVTVTINGADINPDENMQNIYQVVR